MKAKLVVEGKEFQIDILDPELEKLLKPQKQTGYERLGEGHTYSYVNTYGEIKTLDHRDFDDDKRYEEGNYYSNYYVAANNARADRLMRQLRRFAVEHREKEMSWDNCSNGKYYLFYRHNCDELDVSCNDQFQTYNTVYFDSEEIANLAIGAFHDELIWYFTEYKDSL